MHDTYAMLLYRHIRQMHVHVVELLDAGVVLDGAETTESQFEEIRFERPKRCDENVQSKIKLLAADQQRIVDVSIVKEIVSHLYLLENLAKISTIETCNLIT